MACWHFRNRGDCAFLRFFLVIFFRTATAHFCNLYKYFIHYLFYTHIIFFCALVLAIAIASAIAFRIFLFVYFFAASFCALYKYCINFVFIARFAYSHLCIFDEIVFGFRSTNFAAFLCEISWIYAQHETKDLRASASSLGNQCVLFNKISIIIRYMVQLYRCTYLWLMMYSKKQNKAICWHLISTPSESDLLSLAELLWISIHN